MTKLSLNCRKSQKIRPCVIISPNDSNELLETLIVCPITSKRRKYPTRINFKLKGKKNSIAIDQIRTVDESRIVKKVGRLRKKTIKKVKRVLKETLVD
ncbi:type II toxin-antitoxin system PemK/MazF family toxin [Bernardetia sp. OM2101]|uniref:type II toxin-antitoxin system PemK/MazF family toxin n=1 Tax=Bernardetia sp. OM2101 TaxID=3344876 RepID=UPI0035CE9F37